MKNLWVLVPIALLTGVGLGVHAWNAHWGPSSDQLAQLENWPPDAAQVARELATVKDLNQKRSLFASLLTSRFRERNSAIAVRISWMGPTSLKLCCPARMEPWNMSRIALMVWREARVDLNNNCTITIYHTYISPGLVKVGKLLPEPQNPNRAEVVYNFHLGPNQIW